MANSVPVTLAVEDDLTQYLIRVILTQLRPSFVVSAVYGLRGNGYLRQRLPAFRQSSRACPCIVVTDLDTSACPIELIESWFHCEIGRYADLLGRNMLFRVAVREVESWVMADHEGFASFLGISKSLMPVNVDAVQDPKQLLLRLVEKSRSRDLRADLLPLSGDIRRVGANYNGRLGVFLSTSWRVERARVNSASLNSACLAIERFEPLSLSAAESSSRGRQRRGPDPDVRTG